MLKLNKVLRVFLVFAVFASMLPLPQAVKAQDLVPTEELAGGSSVFVFRESRKKPQSRAGGARVSLAAGGQVRKPKSAAQTSAQIAVAAKKRRAAAIAARKQAAKVEANRKLALSNTLTTKAEGFLDSDQTDLAIKNYRDALVQNPKNTRATEGLSNALTAKGIDVAGATNNESAAVYFEEAVKLDAKNDVAYAKLGAIHDIYGRKDKALANYEKALAINPEYSTLFAPIGVAYLDSGEIAKAESYLQKSDAAGVDSADSRYLRGVVLFKQNKDTDAMTALNKALELDGRFVEAQYYRGQILDRTGKSAEALASYRKTLEWEPAFTPAQFEIGVASYNAGDYAGAAAAYEQVIKTDKDNYQAHANLASAYRQLERFADANAEYALASTGIKTADLYSEWGYCLGKVNEWEKAEARLQTAKELSPTAIDNSNVGWAYYNAGQAQTAAKEPEKAKASYAVAKVALETAVQLDPKLDAALLNLGSTHNGLGEFQLAVNVLKNVLGIRKDWAIAANQLGLGYRGLGDLKNAVATFKRIVDLDKNNVSGLFNLGGAYHASGNAKEAKKINDQLRKINPSAAAKLDNVLSGKAVIDATKQKIENKIPKIPRFPFL
ncbi:MAG: tetratricopeptide repeat protein [Pyrinomonadaceae bacterium]